MTSDIVEFYWRWRSYTDDLVEGMKDDAPEIIKARAIHAEAWRLVRACADVIMEAEHGDYRDYADEPDIVDGIRASAFLGDLFGGDSRPSTRPGSTRRGRYPRP